MNRIAELRKQKGLKQIDFASAMGVSQSTLSNWETGRNQADPDSLIKLADYFNVTVDYLMGRDEEKKNPLTPEESERVNKFDELFSSLSEEQQKNAIDYMKFLLSNRAP